MISLDHTSDERLKAARAQLLGALYQHKRKPYLPVWGELFTSLRDIARHGHEVQEDILIYAMKPTGSLWYLYQKKMLSRGPS